MLRMPASNRQSITLHETNRHLGTNKNIRTCTTDGGGECVSANITHPLLILDIPVCVDLCTPTFTNVAINIHICCLQVTVHLQLSTMLAANMSWCTAGLLLNAFVYLHAQLYFCQLMNHQWSCSNGSVDMRLLGRSVSVPTKVMLMGLLLMSTVSHFCHRELQPSICAVSQLECWPRA